MDSLLTPIDLTKYGLQRTGSVKEAIDAFLNLLLSTTCGESPIDPQFGFIFNNMRFEIFNENEGTVNDGLAPNTEQIQAVKNSGGKDLYKIKVSGTSKNINTFATELQKAIIKYEPRLGNVSVSLSYVREEKMIYVSVKGSIIESNTPYKYETTIKIWN